MQQQLAWRMKRLQAALVGGRRAVARLAKVGCRGLHDCRASSLPAAAATPATRSGLHFLVVMSDEEAENSSGLWLLLDRKPPNV